MDSRSGLSGGESVCLSSVTALSVSTPVSAVPSFPSPSRAVPSVLSFPNRHVRAFRWRPSLLCLHSGFLPPASVWQPDHDPPRLCPPPRPHRHQRYTRPSSSLWPTSRPSDWETYRTSCCFPPDAISSFSIAAPRFPPSSSPLPSKPSKSSTTASLTPPPSLSSLPQPPLRLFVVAKHSRLRSKSGHTAHLTQSTRLISVWQ